MSLSLPKAQTFVDSVWEASIVPNLIKFIEIPNKSPMFDAKWREHGHMAKAVDLVANWCKEHAPKNAKVEVIVEGDRTPVVLIDIPGAIDDTVLLYGHLDKQPEMTGWDDDLGPWKPVLRDGKLYGRGGADDGYAAFASLTAINALQKQGIDHARCVVLIEACEESGSYDLPFYIDKLKARLGTPSLVVCLDAGCGNYDQMWCTTSLRGMVAATLRVNLISEGVHSGDASGVVADSFRVLTQLIARVEDPETGKILLDALHAPIPEQRTAQAKKVSGELGNFISEKFPFLQGVEPITDDPAELILNRSWRPTLTVTGADGLPALSDAGNVSRPTTAVRLSFRLPPTVNAEVALKAVSKVLLEAPPYGAKVTLEHAESANGWDAPPIAPWLEESMEKASRETFGAPSMFMGEGGSIPFMGMLGEKFPEAQFLITGVLGPQSNAHGPNEFLHVATARKLTACVTSVLADHATRK